MTKLTEKQVKWLQKAQNTAMGSKVFVAEFDGLLYAACTDSHRLHAIPVEGLEPGQYDLFNGELEKLNHTKAAYEKWPQIVPTKSVEEQIVTPEKLGVLKAKVNAELLEETKLSAICVNERLLIWLDYRLYYDATHYDGQCTMRMLSEKTAVRFDYDNGALAVVQPICPKRGSMSNYAT